MRKNHCLSKACALAEEAAYSQEELEAYWEYWDQVSTERTLIVGSRAEGKVEGLAEGEHLAKDLHPGSMNIFEIFDDL